MNRHNPRLVTVPHTNDKPVRAHERAGREEEKNQNTDMPIFTSTLHIVKTQGICVSVREHALV
jgi:hypothetical protein